MIRPLTVHHVLKMRMCIATAFKYNFQNLEVTLDDQMLMVYKLELLSGVL